MKTVPTILCGCCFFTEVCLNVIGGLSRVIHAFAVIVFPLSILDEHNTFGNLLNFYQKFRTI